jgi:UDP-N-acetylmuramoyl-L-alanyl-D-glutamate--2,6-diaminopimelate ligase
MNRNAERAVALAPLAAALDGARTYGRLDEIASGIVADSRQARPGSVFVALRGEHADGHAFIGAAIAAGARTIVVDRAYVGAHAPPPDVATLVVENTHRALSRLAASFYGNPAAALIVTGVTGTNGKTTTTLLLSAVLGAAGVAAGDIGTLGARFGGATWPLEHTTPLAPQLHALFREMLDRGAIAVTMEVSSHALALARVADVPFRVGVLTNVTRDHLDFHGSFEGYARAKRRLFELVGIAVLNADDACGALWASELSTGGPEVVTYGLTSEARVRPTAVEVRPDGSAFELDGVRWTLRLPGRFNVSNALAALCAARALGVEDRTSASALAAFESVPGRMEHVRGAGIDVLIDYAHTPDALALVLGAAREAARGAVIVVFGCGGERDRGKRPEMGRIASESADRVFVTSDNPRGEDPQAIVAEIARGITRTAGVNFELDRHRAIAAAVASARPGDVVVVAGKGHETYQIVGAAARHFDDRDEVRAALAARETAAPA